MLTGQRGTSIAPRTDGYPGVTSEQSRDPLGEYIEFVLSRSAGALAHAACRTRGYHGFSSDLVSCIVVS
jgi:hypothetical protein